MPRAGRKKSKSGIYHSILRGINRQVIFEDEEDKEKYLQTLAQCKTISGCKIFGYCLMGNHIHMLVQEGKEDMGMFMRRIGARYVYWYNWKYRRCGHLFQDRYKSEEIDDDSYFLTVLRYIHRNPVKAGIAKGMPDYQWSSYCEYIRDTSRITDIDYVLSLFNEERSTAIEELRQYHEERNMDCCLDINESVRLRDEEAKEIILKVCEIKSGTEIQKYDPEKRNEYLKDLKKEEYQHDSSKG